MSVTSAAIAIGRNEGERLRDCLKSLIGSVDRVIYVDSNSSDNSVDIAKELDVEFIVLTDGPFTAARGRQAGLDELASKYTDLKYVQFVDGDCIVQSGWIEAARTYMDENPECAGVCGRRREEKCDESFWSRVIDVDWDSPVGRADYFGGDSFARVQAMQEVGGWNIHLIAGEEPDLCFRMRERGWYVERLDVEMTSHHIDMTQFREYWKRSTRAGLAYVQTGWLNRKANGRFWLRRAAGSVFYGAALPLVALVSIGLGIGFKIYPLVWATIAFIALIYGRQFLVLEKACRRKGYDKGVSVPYAYLNVICKAAAAKGIVQWAIGKVTGKHVKLIEYKNRAVELAKQEQ